MRKILDPVITHEAVFTEEIKTVRKEKISRKKLDLRAGLKCLGNCLK